MLRDVFYFNKIMQALNRLSYFYIGDHQSTEKSPTPDWKISGNDSYWYAEFRNSLVQLPKVLSPIILDKIINADLYLVLYNFWESST